MVINSNSIMTIKKPYSMFQIKPKAKSELNINIKKLQEETLLNLAKF
jgi:hypothetical protein